MLTNLSKNIQKNKLLNNCIVILVNSKNKLNKKYSNVLNKQKIIYMIMISKKQKTKEQNYMRVLNY